MVTIRMNEPIVVQFKQPWRRYQRQNQGLTHLPNATRRQAMSKRTCTIDGCENPHIARGWCHKHYKRWQNHGDPKHPVGVKFSSPDAAIDGRTEWQGDCLIWTGATVSGYGQMFFDSKGIWTHRYVWERANGPIPEGMVVDHLCFIPACCNIDHLRVVSRRQNSQRKSGPPQNNTSGHRGVKRHGEKWQVAVTAYGVRGHYGTYDCIDEAAEVARYVRGILFGQFAGRG